MVLSIIKDDVHLYGCYSEAAVCEVNNSGVSAGIQFRKRDSDSECIVFSFCLSPDNMAV